MEVDKNIHKGLIAALENIVDMLKSEVYSDPSAYTQYEQITDYDEIFVDDDGLTNEHSSKWT